MEGLEKISAKKDLKSYVDQLNQELHHQIKKEVQASRPGNVSA